MLPNTVGEHIEGDLLIQREIALMNACIMYILDRDVSFGTLYLYFLIDYSASRGQWLRQPHPQHPARPNYFTDHASLGLVLKIPITKTE